MKKTKIVIPALGMLLLSTAASVSGTVAWFSMNNAVSVTGMTVSTKVSSNLQISATNNGSDWVNESLTQGREGILEPSSSVNGAAFFYTTNAKADGDAIEEEYESYNEDSAQTHAEAGKTAYDADFNEAYNVEDPTDTDTTAYGYIDYSFYVKGYAAGSGQKLVVTKCDMEYEGYQIESGFAWRVAFFAVAATDGTPIADATAAVAGNQVTILSFAESKYQNQVNAVKPAAETDVSSGYYTDKTLQSPAAGQADGNTTYYQANANAAQAVSSASGLGAVVHPGEDAVLSGASAITANTSICYKVIARLWLEGEDVWCTTSTFAQLTNAWTLDLELKLSSEATPVDAIGNNGSARP